MRVIAPLLAASALALTACGGEEEPQDIEAEAANLAAEIEAEANRIAAEANASIDAAASTLENEGSGLEQRLEAGTGGEAANATGQ